MVRWFKLYGDQYFGFWALGLLLFAVQEIPYMLMPIFHMETNPIMNMVETSATLYYVAIGLWRRNALLVVTGVVFLAVHFTHVYGNLRG